MAEQAIQTSPNTAIEMAEKIFDSFGLMTGDSAPIKRALFGAVLGGVLVTWVKPQLMFTENGAAKPWSLFSSDNSTPVPWYLVSVLFAFVCGVLI